MKPPNQANQAYVTVSINYRSCTSLNPRASELEDYLIEVKAEIVGTHWSDIDDSSPSEVVLGELAFFLIRVGNAVNHGVNLHDVFDVRQETMDAGNAIFDASFRDYKASVQKLFVDAYSNDDVLLLHRLEIHPFARGQKLGLGVLVRAIEDWSSGCSLVLMKPFPLQFEVNARQSDRWEPLALKSFPQDEKQAFLQLRSYYEQLGFRRIAKSEFYGLCTHLKWTALDEMELPDEFVVPAGELVNVS